MTETHEDVSTARRILEKCSLEVREAGPWRWHCAVRNGAVLPLSARVEEGFLQLATRSEALARPASELLRALDANNTLAGGVKFALNPESHGLHLRSDVVLLDESVLLARLRSALTGFRQGQQRLKSLEFPLAKNVEPAPAAPAILLGELLKETPWNCTERGPNEFSVDLQQNSAPPARVATREGGINLSVELGRCPPTAGAAPQALALFLLTATGLLRLVRAYAVEAEGERRFGFEACLPPAPVAEELDHALAALAVAHRECARETSLLLDDAAARSYLTARNVLFVNLNENEKENFNGKTRDYQSVGAGN